MIKKGLKAKNIANYIGSKSNVSEILSYKRHLGLVAVRGLYRHLGMDANILIQEYKLSDKKFDNEKFRVPRLQKEKENE